MRKLWNFPLKLYTQNFRESNIFSKFTKYVSDLTKYFFDESKKHSGVEITDIYSPHSGKINNFLSPKKYFGKSAI